MTSPFKIVDLPNRTWAVSWPEMKPVKDIITGKRLFEMVESINTSSEVGFGIERVGTKTDGELEICWVKDYIMCEKHEREHYADWLCTMYTVLGVVFHKEEDARKLLYELEKRLTWKSLQYNYD